MSRPSATLLALLLIAASGAVYVPSLSGDYVYDDTRFVEENAAVTRGVGLGRYFSDPSTQTAGTTWSGLYRPIRTLSFRVVSLVAPGPFAQRAANLLLHLTNVLLAWILLRGLLGRENPWPPLLGALAFSLHPLASESVAWISSRGDLLALTGMLGALLLHRRAGVGPVVLGPVFFAAALLAKESAIALPVLLVVVDGSEGGLERVSRQGRRYVPYVLVGLAYLGVRYAVLGGESFGQGDVPEGDVLARSSTVLTAGLYYVWTTLLPTGLSFELHILTGADARVLALVGLLLLALLLLAAVSCRRASPGVSLAILWFLAALIPVTLLQLVFPLKIAVANRFAYPALIAFGLLLALLARRGRVFAGLAIAALAAFAPLTFARAEVWRGAGPLWSDVVRRDPGNAVARFGLGREALRAGRYEEARANLVASIKVDPRHPQVHALLGEVFEALAQTEPEGSRRRAAFLAEAFNASNAAVRLWQAGIREDARLYGMTLVNAAYLAGVNGLLEVAREHGRSLLASRPPVPGTGPAHTRFVERLLLLAHYLDATGDPVLAAGLREAAEKLSGEPR